jgi:hypothetical protein
MFMNTLRNRLGGWRPPAGTRRWPQAVYWRRRLVALAIVMAVLSLIAWAFAGAITAASGSGAGSGSGTASGPGAAAGSGQAAGSGPGPGSAGAGPAAGSGAGGQGSAHARPCPHGDVVLSLFASEAAYPGQQFPQFTVDVVATDQATCTFNVGARHVALVIRSGTRQIWSSADCAQGSGTLVSDLQRGVPTVLPISWNRESSAQGCPRPGPAVRAGSYTATAIDGTLASNPVTIYVG